MMRKFIKFCMVMFLSFAFSRMAISCDDSLNIISIKTNPFKYSGYYSDAESNLYYLKARYYSSKLMRFISRDNYDLANRYAYCEGNPISNVDPTGHDILDEFILPALSLTFSLIATANTGGSGLALFGFALSLGSTGAEVAATQSSGETSEHLTYLAQGLAVASMVVDAFAVKVAEESKMLKYEAENEIKNRAKLIEQEYNKADASRRATVETLTNHYNISLGKQRAEINSLKETIRESKDAQNLLEKKESLRIIIDKNYNLIEENERLYETIDAQKRDIDILVQQRNDITNEVNRLRQQLTKR